MVTSIVSKQSSKIRNLVQYTAMLEKRIRDIEHIMKVDGDSIDNHETDH